jgi:DNA-directed RNA polymerase sigma subunit (sigma70/sigma32)
MNGSLETVVADLRAQLVEVAAERDALRAQLEGDFPTATRWLQRKVWRQAAALDTLNRRVVSQRFVLRTLDELGRSLSIQEYRAARDAISNPQLRDRIDDPDAA